MSVVEHRQGQHLDKAARMGKSTGIKAPSSALRPPLQLTNDALEPTSCLTQALHRDEVHPRPPLLSRPRGCRYLRACRRWLHGAHGPPPESGRQDPPPLAHPGQVSPHDPQGCRLLLPFVHTFRRQALLTAASGNKSCESGFQCSEYQGHEVCVPAAFRLDHGEPSRGTN